MNSNATNNQGELLFYTTPSGELKVEVFFSDENFWLTQTAIAELFGVQKPAISKHFKNIFESGELDSESVVSILETTAADGKSYKTRYYNLDAVIALGYRVNSIQATQFRIWATKTLKEFLIKGFVLDSERLKNGSQFGKDYFEELLEKIREIRASERLFYQKITDIYQQCSIDYDLKSPHTQTFFATVQNKLHWAIHGHTAGELIQERAKAEAPNMGLTTWKNAPTGKILKKDVSIAKNYLSEKELSDLNRVVTMYLDYAELQASRQIQMTMADWAKRLDAFLQFNEFEILENAGKISAEVAKAIAEKEFEKFRVLQDRNYLSDFDQTIKKVSPTKGRI
jgi:hypothetical protein